MSPSRSWAKVLPVALGALLVLGASCGENSSAKNPTDDENSKEAQDIPEKKRVESLPQVSTDKMTERERERWVELVNEQLSPCGEPISVARCAKDSKCARCVPAAEYVARLVLEGFDDATIEDYFATRYGKGKEIPLELDGAPVLGAAMAPITIVEFSDFECPFCGRAAPILHEAVDEFPGKVRLIFMHYPLPMHEHALPAAKAAVAAQKQGKFWQMHDKLFENQRNLGEAQVRKFAQEIGLDMAKFETDWKSEQAEAKVMSDKALGRKSGVDSTPTIYINNRLFRYDDLTADVLFQYIREELD